MTTITLTTKSGPIDVRLTDCEFCHDFDPWAIRLRYALPANAPDNTRAELARHLELHTDEYGVALEQHEPKPPERPDPAWEFLGQLQGKASTDPIRKKKPVAEPSGEAPSLIYQAKKYAHFETTGLFMMPPEQVELRWSGPNGGILGTLAVRNRQFSGPELTCPGSPIQQRVRTSIDQSDDSRLVMTTRSQRLFVGGLLLGSLLLIVLGVAFGQLFWLLAEEATASVIVFRCVSGVLVAFGLWGVAFGSYRIWYFSRTVVFDRAMRQLTMKEKSIPRKEPWSCDLKLVIGVEVVRGGYFRELGDMGSDIDDIDEPTRYIFLWELNLIMNSGDRVKLLNESRAEIVVPIGERIASFLQVPSEFAPPVFEKHDGVVVEGELKPYHSTGR